MERTATAFVVVRVSLLSARVGGGDCLGSLSMSIAVGEGAVSAIVKRCWLVYGVRDGVVGSELAVIIVVAEE